ncbi:hypothetical protein [Thalassovita sp.]|uniref:hypothetical protein n=1 Tax=Thalassovita sp. TaxID=1979401 RepID=UPI003B5CA9E6
MVNTNKILTVSYGTFSCTLEGFDDSFDMMKDIAEYFRDLAADDRFFGAEPPTPDADMLARIAEHKMARQVEAREESGSIVLRPTAPAAEAPAAATTAVAAPIEAPAAQDAPVAKDVVTEEPAISAPIEEAVAEAPVQAEPEQAEPEQAEPVQAEIVEEIIEEPAPAPAPAPKFDEESVADKLSRIRAVVSRNVSESEPTADYSEDEHAEDLVQEIAEAEPALAEAIDELSVEDPQLAEDIAESAPEAPEAPAARVIRMKRDDYEAAVADGQIQTEPAAAASDKSLSDADEEDLLRELAEVEAELNLTRLTDTPDAEDDDLSSIFAETEEPAEAPEPEPAPAAASGDTDVSRLMNKAAEEMDRPEGAHRRSAIAHLRAAVEATRAETEAGGGLGQGDDSLDAYRDDLKSVVRPRRPRAAEAQPEHSQRPAKKPAPLKLVAEQRVDAADPTPEARVVRPRRVSLEDDAPQPAAQSGQPSASSFAEFAAQVGVKDLSDVMEAAAAYMSYVEGRQKFSRPQLMNKARQVEEYQFTREDGLRSFGQLLRDGKIEKLKGGRFTVSDELIGFKPDARAAG